MILIRFIAVLAWFVASTLSVSAGEHEAGHKMPNMAAHQDHQVMAASHHDMTGHDHAAMMKAHGAAKNMPDKDDCEDVCCDGLCLCGAAPVPAAIEPAEIETPTTPSTAIRYVRNNEGADPGPLAHEGPPPRLV